MLATDRTATGTLQDIGQLDHSVTSEYRIFGPPGAGKTTNLTRQIRRAVERFGQDSVLVTSFSRTAAAELAGRELPLSPDRIGTLHSHCFHALGCPQIAECNVDDWNNDNPHLQITPKKKQGRLDGDEAASDDGSERERAGDEYLEQLSRWRGMMIPRGGWPAIVREFAAKWQQYKDAHGLLDFCDLIDITHRDVPFAPKHPSVIFADEAQDLNRMQLRLIRKWGERANYFIVAADDDQCQPPGTMVRTRGGEVPIEDLDPERHAVLVYAPTDGRIFGTQGRNYRFRKASRRHDWLMHTIHAGSRSTRCTPEHKFLVRWVKGELLERAHVIYLMRQGYRFRVGWCKLIRSDGVFHLGHRARLEHADAAWVLRVVYNRTEASIYESYIAAKYGLPLATFHPMNGAAHYTEESLGRLFDLLKDDLPLRAVQCLFDHHRDPRFPLYSPQRAAAKRGGSTAFIVEAANLLPRLMAVPVHDSANRVVWVPMDTETGHYRGLVYSLDVEKYHTYIADGIATHNCIYGFTGATPDAVLDPEIPDDHKIILKQSYRVPRAIHARAVRWIEQVTRRQEKSYLPRPFDGELNRLSSGTYKSPEYYILKTALQHLERGQTVMFLAACGYMLQPVIQVLRKNAIPFHNPYRRSNGFWNPLRMSRGAGSNRVLSLLVAHPQFGEGSRTWTCGDLALWVEWLHSEGVIQRGAKKKLSSLTTADTATIETLDDTFEPGALEALLQTFEGNYSELLDWWRRRLNPTVFKRAQFPADIAAVRGPRALLDVPRVVVGTIHSVKGGEADVVYLIPDLSREGDAAYQQAGAPRDSVIRQFYVGMTRARETLYICQQESGMAVRI